MNVYRLLLVLISYSFIRGDSLQIPNRKYTPNKVNPSSDLRTISGSQASTISRHWLNAIMSYKPTIAKEDKHVVDQINTLETHIQAHMTERDLYLAWMPVGDAKEVLFVVVSSIDISNKRLVVKVVVQSPFWYMDQIESSELKVALTDLATNIGTELNLEHLYLSNPRYRLEWGSKII